MFIPRRILEETKSTHPRVNEKIVELVQRKQKATGTIHAQAASEACSAGIKVGYSKYVAKEKNLLQTETRGTKGWRSRERR